MFDKNRQSFKFEIQKPSLKHNKMLWQNIQKNGKKINEGDIIKFGK